jgi:hypothetical protein
LNQKSESDADAISMNAAISVSRFSKVSFELRPW